MPRCTGALVTSESPAPEAIWLGPLFRDGVRGTFSFSVNAGGIAHCSQPFAIGPGVALPDHIEAGSSPEPTRAEVRFQHRLALGGDHA